MGRPSWAVGMATNGFLTDGAQLCTRDGRIIGNAMVRCADPKDQRVAVVTDLGITVVYPVAELAELFHPPQWVMAVPEGLARRRVNPACARKCFFEVQQPTKGGKEDGGS